MKTNPREILLTGLLFTALQAGAGGVLHERLEPHGNWLRVDSSLRVWQPLAAARNPAWRPYYDGGRWRWRDGAWVWMSDYGWGDVVFRQGRWWKAPRAGWVWVPDEHRGTGWVTWRYSDSHWGWAPLPPPLGVQQRIAASEFCRGTGATFYSRAPGQHYVFVPTRAFTRSDWRSRAILEGRSAGMYSRTRSVACGPSPYTVGVSGLSVSTRTSSGGGRVELNVGIHSAPVVIHQSGPVYFHHPPSMTPYRNGARYAPCTRRSGLRSGTVVVPSRSSSHSRRSVATRRILQPRANLSRSSSPVVGSVRAPSRSLSRPTPSRGGSRGHETSSPPSTTSGSRRLRGVSRILR